MRLEKMLGTGIVLLIAIGAIGSSRGDDEPKAEAKDKSQQKAEQAKSVPLPPREVFVLLDANNDLTITRDEVPEEGLRAFETMLKYGDIDRDGSLQANEFRDLFTKYAPAMAGFRLNANFAQLDKDKDGKISKQEFPGMEQVFIRLDTDEDGFVTRGEIAEYQPLQTPGQETAPKTLGTKKENEAGEPAPAGKLEKATTEVKSESTAKASAAVPAKAAKQRIEVIASRRFQKLDKNGDGKVSRDEFPGKAKRFEKVDADGNGFWSLDELRKALEQE